MTQAIATYTTFDETMSLGDLLAKSGFFPDSRTAAQAVVKVLAGREIGFGPIASMTGINVIQGRVSLSANLIAAAIKRSGKYDYRVKDMTGDRCEIDFRELTGGKWEVIGNSTFTASDARTAGTKNMDKFARNMLFARAISNGARWYCPDIFGGPVYTPEELGATVDGETGEVIDAPRTITVERPAQTAQAAANDAAFEQLPSASAERAATNGKATPPANGRPTWSDAKSAIDWGFEQGCFDHRNHAENAWNKIVTATKAEHAPAVPTYAQVFDAWYADVQRRVTEHNVRIDAQLQATLDTQAANDELPVFEIR